MALVALVALDANRARPTQFAPFDRQAQVASSDLIVVGSVVSTRALWAAERSAIFTEVEVAIDEVWKGLAERDSITVRTPGGAMDGISLDVPGAARFAEGEEIVLFLLRTTDGFRPWGMQFGKFEVMRAGDEIFVVGYAPPVEGGPESFARVSLPLEDLRAEVISTLAVEDDR